VNPLAPVDPAARGAGAAATRLGGPADDTLLVVPDIRLLVVEGRRTDDREVVLNFGGGQIVATDRRSGTPVVTIPYRSVAHATYIRARDPRWNPGLASPPDKLDVGGVLRTAKHFLTLQGKDFYQIVRLEDANVIRVLEAVETRTGVTIDRPRNAERN
jgi:hypothetical protein